MPNNEPYLGGSDQTVRYAMGRYEFEVTFEDETHGLQTNLTTGKSRRIQRLQRGEPMPAWEFRESRQQQQVISKPVEAKPQRTEAPKLNATKIDSNLPTCCVMATPTKSYDGDFQWVIELEKGWSAWMPNNEPYLGGTDEPMRYSMGRYDFEVTFEDETHGLQTNVTTGKSRRIQRLQRGEPMPAWEFRESRQQQQPAKSASRPAERKPAPAEPKARATKVDSNLPTCAVVGTSVKKTYEGDFQWVIELEKGWDTWLPQDAPYLGGTDEVMRYSMGRYDFEVHFDSDDKGVQTNLTTGKTRRVQRLQKGTFSLRRTSLVAPSPFEPVETSVFSCLPSFLPPGEPMPAWEGTGTRRRTAGAPAEPAVPKSSAAAAAQANRTVRRTGDTKPTPAQRPQDSRLKSGVGRRLGHCALTTLCNLLFHPHVCLWFGATGHAIVISIVSRSAFFLICLFSRCTGCFVNTGKCLQLFQTDISEPALWCRGVAVRVPGQHRQCAALHAGLQIQGLERLNCLVHRAMLSTGREARCDLPTGVSL